MKYRIENIKDYIDRTLPTDAELFLDQRIGNINEAMKNAIDYAENEFKNIIDYIRERFNDDPFWKAMSLIFIIVERNNSGLDFQRDLYDEIEKELDKIDEVRKFQFISDELQHLLFTIDELHQEPENRLVRCSNCGKDYCAVDEDRF